MRKKAVDTELSPKNAAIHNIAASAIAVPRKKRLAPTARKKTAAKQADKPDTVSVEPVPRKQSTSAPVQVTRTPELPKALVKRPELSPAIQSPYRFPIDIDRVMSSVARVGGVAFVILGALFTLQYASLLMGQGGTFFAALQGTSNLSQLPQTETIQGTIEGTLSQVDSAANQLESFMTIDKQAPLKGLARVTVNTPEAHRVEIFMFTDSWQRKESLGFATQVADDRWTFNWDTTRVESGRNYRISAHVWDASAYETNGNPDFILQLEYMLVDNSVTETAPPPPEETIVDQKPQVTLSAPATLTGASNITVSVAGATTVSLVVEHTDTGSRNYLYNATRISTNEWRVNWLTAGYRDGEYVVNARIQNQYGSYVDGEVTVVLDNVPDTVDAANEVINEVTDDALTEAQPTVPLTLPTLKLRTSEGATVDGTERIEADISVDVASHVYFYLRDPLSAVPRFVGAGIKTTGSTRWYTNWYTNNTPNGTYKLFARAITPPGPIDSQLVTVTVANQVVSEETTVAVSETERITTATNSLAEESETLKAPMERLTDTPDDVDEAGNISTDAVADSTSQYDVAALLGVYREALDAELIRLGTAYRIKDEAAIARIRTRITKLVDQMVSTTPTDVRAELRTKLENAVADIITKYTAEVDRVGQLIEERNQNDVLKDTDKDGISDFDEVTLYNTNPLVADSDNDGFTDGAEILSGFDPLSDVRESVIAYESPKETGIFREDLLVIENVAAAEVATTTTAVVKDGILLTGRALPNSFATLYIFSTPVIVTVKTDAEGAFEYRFDQELEDGQHSVYVGITDNAGRIVAKSQPFGFIKEAQAITPNQAAIVDNSAAAEADDSLITGYAFAAIVSISVVAIGLVLILLGLQLEARRRKVAVPDAMVMPTV